MLDRKPWENKKEGLWEKQTQIGEGEKVREQEREREREKEREREGTFLNWKLFDEIQRKENKLGTIKKKKVFGEINFAEKREIAFRRIG